MSSAVINRVTMFKVTNPLKDDIPTILEAYRTLKVDAKKDGKPYIRLIKAGKTGDDARNQGYNLAITSQYDSLEDMKYYDDECEAHKQLKSIARPRVSGVMTVFFEDTL